MYRPESPEEYASRMKLFTDNRNKFPEEELSKHAGQWIAWAPEGTAIVASSPESDVALYELLEARGLDPGRCLIGYVPEGEEETLGGSWLFGGG
jgi:hypothetical protein